MLPRDIINHTLNCFAAAVVSNFDRALVVLVFLSRICPVSRQTSVFINLHVGERDGKVAGLVDNLAVDF